MSGQLSAVSHQLWQDDYSGVRLEVINRWADRPGINQYGEKLHWRAPRANLIEGISRTISQLKRSRQVITRVQFDRIRSQIDARFGDTGQVVDFLASFNVGDDHVVAHRTFDRLPFGGPLRQVDGSPLLNAMQFIDNMKQEIQPK